MRELDGPDSGPPKGPKGTACRDDMLSVAASISRINDALRDAEKWIGNQTWLGMSADQWYQGPWTDARNAFTKLVNDIEQGRNDCIAAADKQDQAAGTVPKS